MKEKDNLKKFVDEHRSEMDHHAPPVFSRQKHMPKKTVMVKLSSVLKIAAVILILVTVGTVYFNLNVKKNMAFDKTKETQLEDITLAMISEELGEVEIYYTKQINKNYLEIEKEGMVGEIAEQLQSLDDEYGNLKKELAKGIDVEVIIEDMIENYRMKLNLLENVLKKLKQKKHIKLDPKSTNNEKYNIYS